MINRHKVIISNRYIYKEIDLLSDIKKIKIGTETDCDVRLHKDFFFGQIELSFVNMGEEWRVSCSDNLYFDVGDIRKLLSKSLNHGDIFTVKYQESNNEVFTIEYIIDFDNGQRKYQRAINISSLSNITIGTTETNHIFIKSPFVMNDLVELRYMDGDYELHVSKSTYGIYHNGSKTQGNCIIKNGDFFSISDFIFYYKNGILWSEIRDEIRINGLQVDDYPDINNYPKFSRNTRRKIKISENSINILDPSVKPTKPESNLITSLVPSIAMFILVVVMRGFMNTSGGTYVLFSICSMGLGVVTTIISLLQTQKKYKEDIKQREDVYLDYIEKKKTEIQQARKEELNELKSIYYSPEIGIRKVMNFEADIFDRTSRDEDFLDIYLGEGQRESIRAIEYKKQEKLEEGDELSLIPEQISKEYKYLKNAPIIAKLRFANAIGIAGNDNALYSLFKNMVSDLVCRQYHTDVRFFLLVGNNIEQYDWIKWLPQLQNEFHGRNIVFDSVSKNNIFENLYKELTMRSESKEKHEHIIVFVLNDNGIISHPLSKFIEHASNLDTTFLFFENSVDTLPLYCSQIIELERDQRGIIYESLNKLAKQEFTYPNITDELMSKLVEKIAPIYCEEISLESTLRKNISMFETLDIYMAEDLNLEQIWSESKIYESMAVPLGINVKNEKVYLNLHEKAHGPHGLVAGTTGSGKSEILQSYILSAATLFHPYEIGFVIIDFKGGGMVNQFVNLPHLVGAITNIDGKEISRSLKSIKAELLKRQTLFANAGVNHIDKYIKVYKAGKTEIPLPHLVIIVDEFAELKAEQPEFMKELISAARIGRSLGVHLILATQKPAGQVNEQIWSNSKFKLCLKVQNQEDSKEVLKSPLAAEIKEPGRAYLQVGNNEIFELFQSAYSGVPAIREDENNKKKFAIYQVGYEGRKRKLFEKNENKKQNIGKTELEAIVEHIARYCEENHIDKLPNICLPSLPDIIDYKGNNTNELTQVIIGIYDDPEHQYQGEYVVDIGKENTLVIGGSQTGKTNFLQLCIRNLSQYHTPEEVVFYILDFGSMVLKNFENLVHVGGVVLASEDEKVKNLFKLLSQEMDNRKNKLMKSGVSSYFAYKEAGFQDMTKIYVMIDNFNAFKELYMDKYEQEFVRICRDGISLGISIVVTNASTTGIGYRHMSNFSSRICFTCNDTSDYSSMLDRCRTEPKNVPGRLLFQRDKTIYEAQSYLAYEGVREIDRANAVHMYVGEMNNRYEGYTPARKIPAIPDRLTWNEFNSQFGREVEKNEIPLGLDFATIEPVLVNSYEDTEIALITKKTDCAIRFIKKFVRAIQYRNFVSKWNMYIFDGVERELKEYKDIPLTMKYSIDVSEIEMVLERILDNLRTNKEEKLREGRNAALVNQVLILNSKEVIEYISSTKPVLELYKEIVNNCKGYGIIVLYGAVENATVSYNGPELLKRIKENKRAIVLDGLNIVKIFDIPGSVVRNYPKPLLEDEGYWINGTDVSKVKLFSEEG